MAVGKFEIQENDVRMLDGREIDSARQRTRMKQFDVREKLFHKQCKSCSEEFVIIDEQYAHLIVSQQHVRHRTDNTRGDRTQQSAAMANLRAMLHALCR